MAEKEDKYWIQPGICAEHIKTGLEVCVDRIVKKQDGERTLIRGVQCHWLDEHGAYQKGMFLTMELKPCNKE